MEYGPITAWQKGEKVEVVTDCLFLGFRITVDDDDCSHEIRRWLLLGKKAMTNLGIMLKSRHITLPTKVRIVEAMVFPVVTYGCETWIIKKAECQRTDAFELWCWRRLPRVLWTARSNQSILREIKTIFTGRTDAEAPVFWSSIIWYEQNTHWKSPWWWKRLRAEEEAIKGWDGWMASRTQRAWVWASSGRWWKDRGAWHAAVHGVIKSRTWLGNWTTNIIIR